MQKLEIDKKFSGSVHFQQLIQLTGCFFGLPPPPHHSRVRIRIDHYHLGVHLLN